MLEFGLLLLVICLVAALFYLPWPLVIVLLIGASLVGLAFLNNELNNQRYRAEQERRRRANY